MLNMKKATNCMVVDLKIWFADMNFLFDLTVNHANRQWSLFLPATVHIFTIDMLPPLKKSIRKKKFLKLLFKNFYKKRMWVFLSVESLSLNLRKIFTRNTHLIRSYLFISLNDIVLILWVVQHPGVAFDSSDTNYLSFD